MLTLSHRSPSLTRQGIFIMEDKCRVPSDPVLLREKRIELIKGTTLTHIKSHEPYRIINNQMNNINNFCFIIHIINYCNF